MSREAIRTTVRPGAISELLEDLSRAPVAATGWDRPACPGETIGRFRIVREIGRGGFGVVYEAQDLELPRKVALKAVRPGSAARLRDQGAIAEAEAAARLAHPNIVHLYDLGRCDRGAFLVLELLRGETVRARVERGPLGVREAVRIATAAARGLAHAHAAGIVHRDLTPANLFLCEDGQVKVLDFGLAGLFGDSRVAGGTPGYMSPEQSRGDFDARSDLYSLAITIHQLLTGELPFERGSVQGVAPSAAPPPLPGAPSALVKLVGRMLARDPGDRPQNAAEVLDALAVIERSLEPRRGARVAWVLAVAAVALATAISIRPRAAPLPPGRLLIAMADVANSTGDAELDSTGRLLRSALEASKRLSLLDRARLVEVARDKTGSVPTVVDEALARQTAQATGAHAVFLPALRRLGDSYELELRAVDVARNQPLFTLRERAAGRGGVADAIDRLSDRTRKELQEDPKDAAQVVRVSKVVQSKPEAWRLYSQGRALAEEGRWGDAHAAYQKAIEVDPDFPLAHARLAMDLEYADPLKSKEHVAAALRNLDRVPPKERAWVEAQAHLARDDGEAALAVLDRAIASWPEDPFNYVLAAFVFTDMWADGEGGRPYLEKALAVSGIPRDDAIQYLLLLGRTGEALERAKRWAEVSPSARSLAVLSVAHRNRGEREESLAAARRSLALRKGPPEAATFWSLVEGDRVDELRARFEEAGQRSWELLALQGRRREALALIDEGAPPRTDLARRGAYANLRAAYLWGDGDPALVWEAVSEQLLLGQRPSECAAIQLASLGDLEHALRIQALFGGLEKKLLCDRFYRHLRQWRTGDLENAIRGMRSMWMPFAAFTLGQVLADAGRQGEAVEAFRAFRRWPEWDNNWEGASHGWPLSLYLEARSLEKLGRRDEARDALDRLLRLWSRADRDLRPLLQAKDLRARLGHATRAIPAPSPSARDVP